MKSGAAARRFLITAGVLLALLIIGYLTAEQIVIGRIRADLKRAHGDDYAILRMNMGGRPAERCRSDALFFTLKASNWVMSTDSLLSFDTLGRTL